MSLPSFHGPEAAVLIRSQTKRRHNYGLQLGVDRIDYHPRLNIELQLLLRRKSPSPHQQATH
jgi:hypothetical protein